MTLFGTALAETTELTNALEGLTKEEAAAAGVITGAVVGVMAVLAIAWIILQIIADWKIFTKAGEAGWKSIIPFYNYVVEYRLCWDAIPGAVFAVLYLAVNLISRGNTANLPTWQTILLFAALVVMAVLHWIESGKLAKAFGKGLGYTLCLFFCGPIARLALGFGKARFVGKA